MCRSTAHSSGSASSFACWTGPSINDQSPHHCSQVLCQSARRRKGRKSEAQPPTRIDFKKAILSCDPVCPIPSKTRARHPLSTPKICWALPFSDGVCIFPHCSTPPPFHNQLHIPPWMLSKLPHALQKQLPPEFTPCYPSGHGLLVCCIFPRNEKYALTDRWFTNVPVNTVPIYH